MVSISLIEAKFESIPIHKGVVILNNRNSQMTCDFKRFKFFFIEGGTYKYIMHYASNVLLNNK